MKKDKVYLSGKIRGCKDYKAIFRKAEMQLGEMGYTDIFNPAEQPHKSIRACFAADCAYICNEATHIALIDNWRASKGAVAEYHLSRAIPDIKIIYLKKPVSKHLKLVEKELAYAD